MKLRSPRDWGITARLVAVATIPAFAMFVMVNGWLYMSGQAEVAARLSERGTLVVQALAESSQYGVVSGNLSYVERNARRLVERDKSIAAIQVLDSEKRVLVSVGSRPVNAVSTYEAPIRSDVPDINVFSSSGTPHVALPPAASTPFRAGPVVGHVRVTMSHDPVQAERRQRLLLGGGVILLATFISAWGGLILSRSLGAPLRSVMAALRRLRQGHYDVKFSHRASGELGELQGAIVEVAEGLGVTHQVLEQQVASRTRELQEAIAAVQEADAEKRRLIARGNAMVEDERQRLAVEIHDHLNASILVVSMETQNVAALAKQPHSEATQREIARAAERIGGTVQSLYASARNIVKQLRPEILDTLGLRGALQEMVRQYDAAYPACEFSLVVSPDFPRLTGPVAIAAYRLVQEALTNVVKHAHATNALVKLEPHRLPGRIRITITDNGTGFDGGERRGAGLGLIGMRERVLALEGEIAIRSNPLGGTTVDIALPVPPA